MMKKIFPIFLFLLMFSHPVWAVDSAAFGADQVKNALPAEASDLLDGRDILSTGDISDDVQRILTGSVDHNLGPIRSAVAMCCQILVIVMLTAVMRSTGDKRSEQAMVLAAVLAIGTICAGNLSGFFELASKTIDSMSAFAGFLYLSLASATAATGAVQSSASLYGITVLLCSLITRGVETLFLPGISCFMALMIANSALGDDSLRMAADTLKQLLVTGMKLSVLLITAYLSITGVVSGTADSAAIKAAKLTISSTVPVVGSMIADASETLLVSAGLIRSGLGMFGLLGVLAVSAGPFFQTGCQYLVLKGTAAAAGIAGEKELSGLISAMAGAMGMLTGLTGACAVILMIACVCFMRAVP